jgi:hypothetical protein
MTQSEKITRRRFLLLLAGGADLRRPGRLGHTATRGGISSIKLWRKDKNG